MDLTQAQKELAGRLESDYGKREAVAIADLVMESITGYKKLDRLVRKAEVLQPEALVTYQKYRDELLAGRPVQYVLGESWFGGLRFHVDERVLIPRPETEELVEWVAAEAQEGPVLDVGTGSGCIAVTLAHRLKKFAVYACDISKGALDVAGHNAAMLQAEVAFLELDFLDRSQWEKLSSVRLLVSNPPYIPLRERDTLAPHVVNAEPALALFVPDEDALVFYRALGEYARQLSGRTVYAEIHENLAKSVRELFLGLGAHEVIIRKDMQGKDRMVKAAW